MPTYEYACKQCSEHLEVVQSFSDDALTECPNCGGQLRKVFGSVGVTFKGSGFYKNDSRSSKTSTTTATKSSESSSESSSDGSSSTSESTTPAAKPASESTTKPADKAAS